MDKKKNPYRYSKAAEIYLQEDQKNEKHVQMPRDTMSNMYEQFDKGMFSLHPSQATNDKQQAESMKSETQKKNLYMQMEMYMRECG